jgi:hypothetical protein
MQTLTDPILHDVARIIERHPDLSPSYKARLLQGLAAIDGEVRYYARKTSIVPPTIDASVPDAQAPKVKR